MVKDVYTQRYSWPKDYIDVPPHPNLGMVVVIPCHNEPDLIRSLDSLWKATPPLCAIEIIVVINHHEEAGQSVKTQNQATLLAVEAWKQGKEKPNWKVHIIWESALPKKHAGVGLARKIGMDEAYQRLRRIDNTKQGIIVCFDADSTCDANYCIIIESHFKKYPKTPGCGIHYEHPLAGDFPNEIYTGIYRYELHLRYYVDALRWAGYPHAYQTIGSSMAVRAIDYPRVQGMNRRKAGEDFYFLHQIIALGEFSEVTTTRVIPSPRLSDRVPFGTGKAMHNWLESQQHRYLTYHPDTFKDLKPWMQWLWSPHRAPEHRWEELSNLSEPLMRWLQQEKFGEVYAKAWKQSNTLMAFQQHMLRWLDGLRVLKYVHWVRDEAYEMVDVIEASAWLLQALEINSNLETRPLEQLRQWDKSPWHHPCYPAPKEAN